MSIDRQKTWCDGEVLTAGDLNGEFNNIIGAGISLVSPLKTGESFAMAGNTLFLDADNDTSIIASTDDLVQMTLEGVLGFEFDGRTDAAVNGLVFTMDITTVAPQIGARSTADTNVDINMVPLGDGQLQINGVDLQNIGDLHHSVRYYGS